MEPGNKKEEKQSLLKKIEMKVTFQNSKYTL